MARWIETHPTFMNKTDLSSIIVHAVHDEAGVFAASLEGVSYALDNGDITELRDLSLLRWNTAYIITLDAHQDGAEAIVSESAEDTVQAAVAAAFTAFAVEYTDSVETPRGVREIRVSFSRSTYLDETGEALGEGASERVMPALRTLVENLSTHYFTQVRR